MYAPIRFIFRSYRSITCLSRLISFFSCSWYFFMFLIKFCICEYQTLNFVLKNTSNMLNVKIQFNFLMNKIFKSILSILPKTYNVYMVKIVFGLYSLILLNVNDVKMLQITGIKNSQNHIQFSIHQYGVL